MNSSGQEDGKENLRLFNQWAERMTDADFRAIERGGKLNRSEIVKATGFGRSVLQQNPGVKDSLTQLEAELRRRGVLPPLSERAAGEDGVDEAEPLRPQGQASALTISARLKSLEQQVDVLRAENTERRRRRKKFEVLESAEGRTGRLPR